MDDNENYTKERRLECLRLALQHGCTVTETVNVAKVYANFVEGKE